MINDQGSSEVAGGSPDAGRDYGNQFIALTGCLVETLTRDEADATGQHQPHPGFAQFLRADPELVNEVPARFGRLRF